MYAVVETGGKQYRVAPGQSLRVERLDGGKGDEVVFDRVIMIGDDGGSTHLGAPLLDGASVKGRVVHQGRAKKVLVFKYKKRKRYRVKTGHRQLFTLVRIDSISR
ncbi:MAG: 50S ribosomal protein L21 [Armatimonadetes bacterium]|nr:50S ribosomal protein L21 [Armatimonadota bacterium]